MSAQLIELEAAATNSRGESARYQKLKEARHATREALHQALIDAGIINQWAGQNGHTQIHTLLDAYETADMRWWMYLEDQLTRVRRQLENVLAHDAFTDPDSRRAVLTTINRQGGKRLADSALYSGVEQELITCYRRLAADDRSLFRMMLRRLGAQPQTDEGGSDDE